MNKLTSQERVEATTEINSQSADNANEKIKRYIIRLRFKFLTPIIITLSFAVMVIISIVYFHEYQTIDSDVIQLQSTASSLYQNSIQQNSRALQTVMDVLKTDRELSSALAQKDRKRLLQRSASLYADINRHYGVTHFYFSDTQRVNLLRVHKPEKYGDIIVRQTTLTAQKSGIDAYGVELGPLGTMTLRYVQPWYEEQTQELLGFVELGMEVDQTFNAIRDLFGVELFLLIRKKYLERSGWEEGMRTFGRLPDWERFPQVVISMHGKQLLPEALSARIQNIDFYRNINMFKTQLELESQYAIFQSLEDVSGQAIGVMVMLFDTSRLTRQVRQSVFIGSVSVIIAAAILILFFYWFVGRIGLRMAQNELQLQQMATHDALTGLNNRRYFDRLLEDSISLTKRYGRPVSLLMIDIDHFKKVNDQYGHPVGDAVLVELGQRLTDQARINDRVCRYGGEEFSVLLPETDAKSALEIARRICRVMENEVWDVSKNIQIGITVSIGVASLPSDVNTSQKLVTAADKALYAAKQAGRNRVCSYADIG